MLKRNLPQPVNMDHRSRLFLKQADDMYRRVSLQFVSEPKRWEETRKQLYKSADFGENQNPQFEKAFGTVAFTYLREKAPSLLKYVIGFQLLDRTDKGRRAVGAFVAKVGEKIIDIPMFFIDGELRGHQIMRLRSPELYVPLRESFLEHLLSKVPQELGDAGPSIYDRSSARSTPDLQPYSGSRFNKFSFEDLSVGQHDDAQIHKFSDESPSWYAQWTKHSDIRLHDAYLSMKTDPISLQVGIDLLDKKAHSHVDLQKLLNTSASLLKTAAVLCDNHPNFHAMLDRLLGNDWLQKAATAQIKADAPLLSPLSKQTSKQNSKHAGLTLVSGTEHRVPQIEFVSGSDYIAARMQTKQASLQVTPATDHSQYSAEIQTYGDVLFDRRELSKCAQVYTIEPRDVTLTTPVMPDMYDVIDGDQKSQKMLVIPARYRHDSKGSFLIVNPKTGAFANAMPDSFIAQSCDDKLEDTKRIEDLFKGSSSKPSDRDLFVVVSPQEKVYGPYVCSNKLNDNCYEVEDFTQHGCQDSNYQHIYNSYDRPVSKVHVIGDRFAVVPSDNGATLVVPASAKIFKLLSFSATTGDSDNEYSDNEYSDNKYFDNEYSDSGYHSSKNYKDNSYRQSLLDSNLLSTEQLFALSNLVVKTKSAGLVEINDITLKQGAARKFLITRYGLSKDSAQQVLTATPGKPVMRYCVTPAGATPSKFADVKKFAAISPTIPMPNFDGPQMSESGRTMVEIPQEMSSSSLPEPERQPLGPYDEPPGSAMNELGGGSGSGQLSGEDQNAIESDQNDIMSDMTGLTALLKNTRIDVSIKAFTKALLQAIDRNGRQQIIFHSHPEEFADMYGEEDLESLQSLMETTFETAGDLFIKLTRRAADPNPELDFTDVSLEAS